MWNVRYLLLDFPRFTIALCLIQTPLFWICSPHPSWLSVCVSASLHAWCRLRQQQLAWCTLAPIRRRRYWSWCLRLIAPGCEIQTHTYLCELQRRRRKVKCKAVNCFSYLYAVFICSSMSDQPIKIQKSSHSKLCHSLNRQPASIHRMEGRLRFRNYHHLLPSSLP